MQRFLLAVTVVVASLIGTTAGTLSSQSYRVHTTSGTLIGHQAANISNVTEFLGIRYAEAPVGQLRFAAPKKYVVPVETIFEASEWSPDCPSNKPPVSSFPNFTQPSGLRVWKNFAAQNNNTVSEDCLKLNVWAKNLDNVDVKRPVLVFLHGGRFQIPGPHSPFYNGQYLSDAEDVIVVTVNYRLGIFGFSGAPGVDANAALRDHRVAVEWVYENIAAFGGDPSRIVIFGQSAGGASVDYWSFAWKDRPIISGLISMSGTSLSFLPNTREYSQMLWYNVSQAIGCGGPHEEAADVLLCVRSKNTTVILAAAAKVPPLPTQATVQATFHPTIDNVTVFADYEQLSASGIFAKIPILAGNAANEDGWYRLAGYAAKLNFTEPQWSLFRERAFTCPTAYTTRYRVKYGVPTWRYIYHGDWDNLQLYNGASGLGPKGSGAYHGSDLNMIFGTAQDVSGLANMPNEDATSKYMMSAWAAFARDSKAGLTGYGWPPYGQTGATLARIAYNNSATPAFVHPMLYDQSCPAKNDPLPGRGAF